MELRNNAELKSAAMKRLPKCWSEAIGIIFITIGYFAVFSVIWMMIIGFMYDFDVYSGNFAAVFTEHRSSFLCLLAAFFVISYILKIPFDFGVSWFLLQSVRGNSVQSRSFFGCYTIKKRFTDTIRIRLIVFRKKLFYVLPIIIAAIAEHYIAFTLTRTTGNTFWYTFSTVLLILAFCCLVGIYSIFSIKYCLVPFVFALNPDSEPETIINEAVKIMYGRVWYMIEVISTFVKWLVPCLLVFPVLFIVPYILFVYAEAVNGIIDNYYANDNAEDDENKVSKQGDFVLNF